MYLFHLQVQLVCAVLHVYVRVFLMAQVECARGILRRLTGDPGENRELAVFSLEKAIQDYEARKPQPGEQMNSPAFLLTVNVSPGVCMCHF